MPRSRKEIADFLNISKTATYELLKLQVKAGKLKLLMPERSQSTDQKFIAAEVDICILTADTIAEFCKTARTRAEIAERYCLSQRTARTYIQAFIRSGVLNYTIPEYTLSKFQKYIKV
jgi:predicted transcriptional regulator